MAKENLKLNYYGSDYTPLKKDNEDNTFFFEVIGTPKKAQDLSEDKSKQYLILESFLKYTQKNISSFTMIKDSAIKDCKLYNYHEQKMYFDGLVGVISIKDFVPFQDSKDKYDITLQINSRLDCGENQDKSKIKPYFLMTLLFSGFVPLPSTKINSDSEKLTDMLLLYLYYEYLKNAYIKGYFKTYQRFQRNDDKLKGSIDVSRHIKTNMGLNNGKIAYSFKEKSENNYINHLIVASYENLKKKYFSLLNNVFDRNLILKNSIETLKHYINFPAYSLKHIISKNIYPLTHPYFTEYEELRKVCLKVLRDEKTSIFNGDKKEKISGVLAYIPTLWEKYIEKYMHDLNFKSQDEEYIFDINGEEKWKQLSIPDFVLYNENNEPYMVIDAKMKPKWLDAAITGKMGELGLLSDYDKCIRDMVTINAHACGVIFPTNKKIENYTDESFELNEDKYKYCHNISKFNQKAKFYTFPIYVPPVEEDNLLDWKTKFEQSFSDSMKGIKNLITNIRDTNN